MSGEREGAETTPAAGLLIGVGLGPGDPELLTLKAWRLIGAAEIVAYPAPIGTDGAPRDSLARRIAADFVPEDAEEIAYPLPMRAGETGPSAAAYDAAAQKIASRLDAGRDVLVLCEGDPLFYGSFLYLLDRLSGRFEIEIVPGVTSFAAAAAALQRPLASRDESLLVLPATLPDAEIEQRLAGAEAAVFLKLGRHLPRIRALLTRLGLDRETSYAERIGQEGERFGPLSEAPAEAPYFSLLLLRRGAAT